MQKGVLSHIDFGLLVPVLILVCFSLATLFSLSFDLFRNQLFFVLFSLVVFVFFTNVNYKLIEFYALPLYLSSLLVLVFVLFLGFESRGAVRWVSILGVQVQFSEILKPFLTLAFASFLARADRSAFKNLMFSGIFVLPIALLITLQPDLGNGLLYLIVSLLTLVVVGFPLLWFGIGFGIAAALTPVFWHFLRVYQKQRIMTFFNPSHDPLGTSYNAIQSLIAVGSGMILGKGLGEGTQSNLHFLPERHTDFIFATLSESFGLIGVIILLACFAWLLYRIIHIYQNSTDGFYKIVAICAFFVFSVQFFVNIGMNIGIVPIVGVTLPFISYGGSSILSSFILLGCLSSISKQMSKSHEALEIR